MSKVVAKTKEVEATKVKTSKKQVKTKSKRFIIWSS